MFKIKVVRTLQQPIEHVFDALCDHEHYSSFPMITYSELLSAGKTEKNGSGAFRKIESGGFKVKERILDFSRPSLLCYQIEQAKPVAIDHQVGRIELKSVDDNSVEVTWISEGKIKVPLIGRLLDKQMEKNGTAVFHSMLKYIEKHGRLS